MRSVYADKLRWYSVNTPSEDFGGLLRAFIFLKERYRFMKKIKLIKAALEDAALLHKLQREAFMPLYERYHDDETSPAMETVERIFVKITESDFWLIYLDDEPVGGIRVRLFENNGINTRNISPMFVIPSHWDEGIGTEALTKIFGKYSDTDKWSLATIEQDDRNCHFYEKLGFVRTGSRTVINDDMTIIGFERTC